MAGIRQKGQRSGHDAENDFYDNKSHIERQTKGKGAVVIGGSVVVVMFHR
jgi:hypothetical protein